MKDERLYIRPISQDSKCEAHNWPTRGMARRLVVEMRRTFPTGINVCRDCVARARDGVKPMTAPPG